MCNEEIQFMKNFKFVLIILQVPNYLHVTANGQIESFEPIKPRGFYSAHLGGLNNNLLIIVHGGVASSECERE